MPRQAPPRHRPPDAQPLMTLATAHHKAGRHAEAERLYRQVLMQNPRHVSALMNLGALQRATGRPREAIALYERSLGLAPDHPGLRLNLGNAWLDLEDWAAAEHSLRLAAAGSPGDIQILTSLSRAVLEQGKAEEAIALCRAVIAREPKAVKARRNLYLALQRIGQNAAADDELRRIVELVPDDPAGRHLLAAAEGRTTAGAPADYVRGLFDGFAPHFEAKLRGQLGYRTPELLLDLLRRHLPADRHFAHALDLGCGTGLMGPLLRPLARRLEGVDLSPRMLEAAQAKQVYDSLAMAEIVTHLGGMEARPDLVTAADVLVYIGDLAPLMRGLAGRLAPGGLVLVSTEAGEGGGFRLLATGRYAHDPAYVEATARAHGLAVLATETAVIRRDEGQAVTGGLHLLRLGGAAGIAAPAAPPPPPPTTTTTTTAADAMAQARAMQAAGRHDEAARLYAAILAGQPRHLEALRQLGIAERRQTRIQAAVQAWRQALDLAPADAWLHKALGEALAQLHDFAAAAGHFGRAAELAPGDPGPLHGLGAMRLQTGDAEGAIAALRRAAGLAPGEPNIHFELARALALTGAAAEARQALEQARDAGLDADNLGYLEHLIEGRDGGAATVASLQRLYDRAAPHYESHVVTGLDNRTWRLLLELLDREPGLPGRWRSGLELGCGPGMAGPELRRRVDRLTGVDLSPVMIEQAGRRRAYDRLAAADLMAFLGDPDETEDYDLMFAADVLPHIGDFVALLTVAAARLQPGGLFLFSTEHSEDVDRVPLPEFRFRHSLAHVENAAVAAGLAVAAHEVRQIRVERGAPVMGGLYLLRRPA